MAPGGSAAVSEVLTLRFARQVVAGRWFMALACLMILSASGATYAFGIYSTALKSSLGYDQRTLNTLAFFKDLGSNQGRSWEEKFPDALIKLVTLLVDFFPP
jgi:hypothetical protein